VLNSTTNSFANNNSYIIHETEVVGTGTTCTVKLATHVQSGKLLSAKIMNLQNDINRMKFSAEVAVFMKIRESVSGNSDNRGFSNIVKFYDYCIVDDMGVIFLEKFDMTLEDFTAEEKPNPELAVDLFLGIVSGLESLHGIGIAHSDIKPENIGINVTTMTPLIFDFGLSTQLRNISASSGSPLYMSPERLSNLPHDPFSADIWSAGITFYELLTGTTPFDDCEDIRQLYTAMKRVQSFLNFKDTEIRNEVSEIVLEMLKWNPSERCSFSDINRKIRKVR